MTKKKRGGPVRIAAEAFGVAVSLNWQGAHDSEIVITRELAIYLRVQYMTVCQWRFRGVGPRFHYRICTETERSFVYYTIGDVRDWLKPRWRGEPESLLRAPKAFLRPSEVSTALSLPSFVLKSYLRELAHPLAFSLFGTEFIIPAEHVSCWGHAISFAKAPKGDPDA